MAYNKNYRNAAWLTAQARNAYNQLTAAMPLGRWFPFKANPNLNYEFDLVTTNPGTYAEFRDFDAENAKGKQFAGATAYGRLVPIGKDYRVTEYEAMYRRGGLEAAQAIQMKLDELAVLGGKDIARRLELARLDALLTGSVSLQHGTGEPGGRINWNRDPSLSVVKAPGQRWTVDTVDPIADSIAWRELVRAQSGVLPVYLLAGGDVIAALRRNKIIRDYFYAGMASVGNLVTIPGLEAVLSQEAGIQGIINMDDAYALNADIGLVNPWPRGTIAIVAGPSQSFGATEFTETAFSTDSQFGISGAQRYGILGHAFDQDNVFGLWVGINATALPTMPRFNQVLTAQVIAG